MGFFSKLFSPKESLEVEVTRQEQSSEMQELTKFLLHWTEAMKERLDGPYLKRAIIDEALILAKKRMSNDPDGIKWLEGLSDESIMLLPEALIMVMFATYLKSTREGASHLNGIFVVDLMRPRRCKPEQLSNFSTIEDYIIYKLKSELSVTNNESELAYITPDYVASVIRETRLSIRITGSLYSY